jgi:glucose-6-phosphate 1-dehydrogenase
MAQLIPVETFDLIIFGGTGDLAMRKLLPALYHRASDGQISDESRIIAVGRGELIRSRYVDTVHKALKKNLKGGEYEAKHWREFESRLHYVHADATDAASWTALGKILRGKDDRTRVFYLAGPQPPHSPVDTLLHLKNKKNWASCRVPCGSCSFRNSLIY